ncbi:hypothetical protein T4C_667 [Trichinella pseudospiralis]|uniref:Uncharacterized protein n=1 Tax=Trichinella pseudospiralis TaxID=6337 RepID=A0A0V1IMU2_TRIPS|nr:hypothetical protein T4C_667 [Trichinella pseudospiralis]
MVFRRFLKSSSLTSLFSVKLFENENLSGDFRNHPHTHHFSHSISLKMEIRLLKSSSLT